KLDTAEFEKAYNSQCRDKGIDWNEVISPERLAECFGGSADMEGDGSFQIDVAPTGGPTATPVRLTYHSSQSSTSSDFGMGWTTNHSSRVEVISGTEYRLVRG